jgi:hypothetical protein
MTYDGICSFDALYRAYKRARRSKRNKTGEIEYEAHALAATHKLSRLLLTRQYQPGEFELFYVYEPKKRKVQAPAFVDKVVQHAMVDNYLYDAICKSFITDNYASQIGKGVHFGLGRLQGFMREYYRRRKGRGEQDTAAGWILKADIRHFFENIDHDILKNMLRKKIADDDVYNLMCLYIDKSPGLPLGYQTSQLFALLYLDGFDHWIKEACGAKYYGRYMDDFFIIHEDKDALRGLLLAIRERLSALGLELNEKTAIFPLRNGIDFLGFHAYLTDTGKVVTKLRNTSKKRMRRRIKKWAREYGHGELSQKEIETAFTAWCAHAKNGNTQALRAKYRMMINNIYKGVGEEWPIL